VLAYVYRVSNCTYINIYVYTVFFLKTVGAHHKIATKPNLMQDSTWKFI
jgi:hypothetical protein